MHFYIFLSILFFIAIKYLVYQKLSIKLIYNFRFYYNSYQRNFYSIIYQSNKKNCKHTIKSKKSSFESFFKNSPFGLLRVDIKGNILLFNTSISNILGLNKQEELLCINYFNNKYRDLNSKAEFSLLLRNLNDFTFEENWRKPQGNIVILKEFYRVIKDNKGVFQYFEITVDDITEKKRTERYLQITEEKFKNIIDQIPIGIYRTISTGEIIFANKYLANILGYSSPEVFNNKNITSFLLNPIEYETQLKKQITHRNNSFLQEYIIIRKDGAQIWVKETSNIIYDNSNDVLFIESIVEEITSKKNTEQELNRLFTAINQISESIVITDIDGYILYTNQAFEKMTLYSGNEVKGQKISILKSGQHSNEFYKKIWDTILSGKNWTGRINNRKKNGLIYEEHMVISPVKNHDGQIVNFVAIKRDITEEIKTERRLNQSHKLQAIGTLAGGIAHDFNNILMGMQIYTEILLKKISQDSNEYNTLQKVYSAQNRAKDLIKQILSFSRQSSDDRIPIQVHIIIKEALKLIKTTFPLSIKLKQNIKDCGFIMANPTHIHQIIMNLCTNAIHAMEGNGTLYVELNQAENIEYPDGTKMGTNNNWMQLKVKDTGCGIEKKIQNRIFEPFFTTKSVGHGTGLGLATIHGIIKQYGGEIFFSSEVGKGTVFCIYLPVL